jgi:hypothetical protein
MAEEFVKTPEEYRAANKKAFDAMYKRLQRKEMLKHGVKGALLGLGAGAAIDGVTRIRAAQRAKKDQAAKIANETQ